jgi:hypothetical protein
MEEAVASLEAKLVQLNMAKNRVEKILKTNDHARIERQQETLKNLISEANTCKNTVEGMKIAQKVSPEEIEAWNRVVEGKIGEADSEVARLKAWLDHRSDEAREEENRRQRLRQLQLVGGLSEMELKWQIIKNFQ